MLYFINMTWPLTTALLLPDQLICGVGGLMVGPLTLGHWCHETSPLYPGIVN